MSILSATTGSTFFRPATTIEYYQEFSNNSLTAFRPRSFSATTAGRHDSFSEHPSHRLSLTVDRLRDNPSFHTSTNTWNETSSTRACTSRPRFPLTLELASPGLPKQSCIKISQIRTLSVERIGKKITEASPEELAQVVEGLNEIVG